MINYTVTLQLNDLIWQSDWNGFECGFDSVDIIGYYCNEIDEQEWNYYIDMDTMELLSFWRTEDDY